MSTHDQTDRLSGFTGDSTGNVAETAIEVSIVLPIYNEEDSIEELYFKLRAVMDTLQKSYEIVFVNDGSRDCSVAMIKKVTADDPHVRLITLRRNFGQTPALAAGFDAAVGKVIIAMDADLQHNPEEIPKFLAKIDEGYDVVSGWREKRVDNFILRRIPSLIANRLMKYLSGVDLHDFGTTYKAYRSEVIKNVRLYGELHRFIPALTSYVGAKICELPIQNINRPYGKSNYGIGRTIRVLFDLMTVNFLLRYLQRPLQFFGLLGLSCFSLGSIFGLYLLGKKIFLGTDIFVQHAPMTLLSVLLIIISISFISMGLLGEVLARIYHEATGRTIYYIRDEWRGGKK
jgi:glycosyltransferase involved in cell wall biosynthesis